jgi:hypothetical protein
VIHYKTIWFCAKVSHLKSATNWTTRKH